jgi:AcrR family transcriptional regulator
LTRLAVDRDTPLTAAEIAMTAFRQFDEGPTDPSIRSLAGELQVSPAAIYHHYRSIAEVHQAAVELAWNEAITRTLDLLSDLRTADAAEMLVAVGIATRRTWLGHFRLARHMAATPDATAFTSTALEYLSGVFGQLDIDKALVAQAFHSYSSFMIGAVLFAASRAAANESLSRGPHLVPVASAFGAAATRHALDSVMEVSDDNPELDEEFFAEGLRRLLRGFER